jgi:hypothetical protein
LVKALGDVAKARGLAEVAKVSGLGRESLYKTLAPGAKPRFETIAPIMGALNVGFSVESSWRAGLIFLGYNKLSARLGKQPRSPRFAGRKRQQLDVWFSGPDGPSALFAGRVLPFDEKAGASSGRI